MRHLPRAMPTVVLALLTAACAGGGDPLPEDGPGSGGGEAALHVTVETDREVYEAGDEVLLTLTLRNESDAPATLSFASSQRYDFQVEDGSGDTVWSWSASRSFLQVLGEETVPAGGTLTWTESLEIELPPGEYAAVGSVTSRDGPLVDRTDFTVR